MCVDKCKVEECGYEVRHRMFHIYGTLKAILISSREPPWFYLHTKIRFSISLSAFCWLMELMQGEHCTGSTVKVKKAN